MVEYTEDEMEFVSDSEAREYLEDMGISRNNIQISETGAKARWFTAHNNVDSSIYDGSQSTRKPYVIGSYTGNRLIYLYKSGLSTKYGFNLEQAREFTRVDAEKTASSMKRSGTKNWMAVRLK